MVLELRRDGAVLGPVTGVVRALASSLTSTPSSVSKSSTASMPVTSSSRAMRRASASAREARSRVQPRRRRDHLPADPLPLRGLHDRVGRRLPARAPRDQGGELATERHTLLGEQAYAAPLGHLERGRALRRRTDEPDPLAVVPAARRLQDAGEAEVGDLLHALHDAPPRQRGADARQRLAHHDLVLRVDQRLRTGADRRTRVGQRVQVVGGHVLVVERDDATAHDQALSVARSV